MKLKPRKITTINYTYFVSLPHDWLYNHVIGKGDYIDFEYGYDGALILRPNKEENETAN